MERGSRPAGNSQVAIDFLRHPHTDLLEKQLNPLGSNYFAQGRSIRPSAKYVDDLKKFRGNFPVPRIGLLLYESLNNFFETLGLYHEVDVKYDHV